LAIHFFSEEISFRLSKKQIITKWIKQCITLFEKKQGDINIIFTSDEYLVEINKNYLKRDYLTDIITFDYSENNTVSGDLFISIPRIEYNASINQQMFHVELNRVIIHGILHLIGFNDATDVEKQEMRKKEDFCLALLKE
jgi:probable rRNA maturation factor